MKICPNCKASVVDTAKFCHKCRFNIKEYEEKQAGEALYCTECGAEIQLDADFCTECGADVVRDADVSNGASGLGGVTNSDVETLGSFNFDAVNTIANKQLLEKEGFICEDDVLMGYKGKKRSIVIHGVEEIYDGAFENNQIVTCIEIDEGIKSIGRKAFAFCPSLVEISIPASCKIIYSDTFKGTSLRTLILSAYKEEVVFACLSDTAKNNIYRMKISDAVTEKGGKVFVNIELIEMTVAAAIKEEEDRIAEKKRQEEQKREEERARKEREEKEASYNKYNVGTVHTMGIYNHGINARNIEWIVLERNGDKALLISKYIIDRQVFHEKSEYTCWEMSTIRSWLNNQFYNIAFSEQEKSRILTSFIKNAPNPQHGTSSGNDTYDKIFLLNTNEVEKYFKTSQETKCQVTLYAKNKGAYCDGAYFGYWWLRTSGQLSQNASYVFYTGGVSNMGYDVTGIIFGVRPAMWISIS